MPSLLAIVEKLLAPNLVVLDRVDAGLFERGPLAGGFGRDVEGKSGAPRLDSRGPSFI